MITIGRVGNMYPDADMVVRVDRPGILGNGYRIGVDGSREEVVALYALDLEDRMRSDRDFARAVNEITFAHLRHETVVLLCHCAPKLCHALVLAVYCDYSGEPTGRWIDCLEWATQTLKDRADQP